MTNLNLNYTLSIFENIKFEFCLDQRNNTFHDLKQIKMSQAAIAKIAKRELHKDIEERFMSDAEKKIKPVVRSVTLTANYQKSLEIKKRKIRQRELLGQKMLAKQQVMLQNHIPAHPENRNGPWTVAEQAILKERRRSAYRYGSCEPDNAGKSWKRVDRGSLLEAALPKHGQMGGLSTSKTQGIVDSQKRVVYKQRQQELDERIKSHFQYPNGPLAMVQGLQKADGSGERACDEIAVSHGHTRVTNKIQIEEMLRLKKKNYETTYIDATLDFINLRGSDYGLTLSEFVKKQFWHEEQEVIKSQLSLGVQTMKMLREKPNEHIRRYWIEKTAQIKAHIEANKYKIDIPEPLQFPETMNLTLDEVKDKLCDQMEKIACASGKKQPTYNSKATLLKQSNMGKPENSKTDLYSESQVLEEASSAINNVGQAETKPYQIRQSDAIKHQQMILRKRADYNKNQIMRPTTAQPLTRLRRATTLAAHKYTSLYKTNLKGSSGKVQVEAEYHDLPNQSKTPNLAFNNSTCFQSPSANRQKIPKHKLSSDLLTISGIPKTIGNRATSKDTGGKDVVVKQQSQASEKEPLKSLADEPSQQPLLLSQDGGHLDSFTRSWLNLDLMPADIQQRNNEEVGGKGSSQCLSSQEQMILPGNLSPKQIYVDVDKMALEIQSYANIAAHSHVSQSNESMKIKEKLTEHNSPEQRKDKTVTSSQQIEQGKTPVIDYKAELQNMATLKSIETPFRLDPNSHNEEISTLKATRPRQGILYLGAPISKFSEGEASVVTENKENQSQSYTDSKSQRFKLDQHQHAGKVNSTLVNSPKQQSSKRGGDVSKMNGKSSSKTNNSNNAYSEQKYQTNTITAPSLQTQYQALPLTSLHVDEDIDRPYRSLKKVPSMQRMQRHQNQPPSGQRQSSKRSASSLLTTQGGGIASGSKSALAKNVTEMSALVLHPSKSSLSRGSRQSGNSFKKLSKPSQQLLQHPDQITIQTTSNHKLSRDRSGKRLSTYGRNQERNAHKRNTSSVDMSAGVMYYNQSSQHANSRSQVMGQNGIVRNSGGAKNAASRNHMSGSREGINRTMSRDVLRRSPINQDLMLADNSAKGKLTKAQRIQRKKARVATKEFQNAEAQLALQVASFTDVGPINIETALINIGDAQFDQSSSDAQNLHSSSLPVQIEVKETDQVQDETKPNLYTAQGANFILEGQSANVQTLENSRQASGTQLLLPSKVIYQHDKSMPSLPLAQPSVVDPKTQANQSPNTTAPKQGNGHYITVPSSYAIHQRPVSSFVKRSAKKVFGAAQNHHNQPDKVAASENDQQDLVFYLGGPSTVSSKKSKRHRGFPHRNTNQGRCQSSTSGHSSSEKNGSSHLSKQGSKKHLIVQSRAIELKERYEHKYQVSNSQQQVLQNTGSNDQTQSLPLGQQQQFSAQAESTKEKFINKKKVPKSMRHQQNQYMTLKEDATETYRYTSQDSSYDCLAENQLAGGGNYSQRVESELRDNSIQVNVQDDEQEIGETTPGKVYEKDYPTAAIASRQEQLITHSIGPAKRPTGRETGKFSHRSASENSQLINLVQMSSSKRQQLSGVGSTVNIGLATDNSVQTMMLRTQERSSPFSQNYHRQQIDVKGQGRRGYSIEATPNAGSPIVQNNNGNIVIRKNSNQSKGGNTGQMHRSLVSVEQPRMIFTKRRTNKKSADKQFSQADNDQVQLQAAANLRLKVTVFPSNRNNSSLANSVGKHNISNKHENMIGSVTSDFNNRNNSLQINTNSQHRYSNQASTVKNNGTVRFTSLSKTQQSKKTGGHSSTKISSQKGAAGTGKHNSIARKGGLRKLRQKSKKMGSPQGSRLIQSMAKNVQEGKNGDEIEFWDTINIHEALGQQPQTSQSDSERSGQRSQYNQSARQKHSTRSDKSDRTTSSERAYRQLRAEQMMQHMMDEAVKNQRRYSIPQDRVSLASRHGSLPMRSKSGTQGAESLGRKHKLKQKQMAASVYHRNSSKDRDVQLFNSRNWQDSSDADSNTNDNSQWRYAATDGFNRSSNQQQAKKSTFDNQRSPTGSGIVSRASKNNQGLRNRQRSALQKGNFRYSTKNPTSTYSHNKRKLFSRPATSSQPSLEGQGLHSNSAGQMVFLSISSIPSTAVNAVGSVAAAHEQRHKLSQKSQLKSLRPVAQLDELGERQTGFQNGYYANLSGVNNNSSSVQQQRFSQDFTGSNSIVKNSSQVSNFNQQSQSTSFNRSVIVNGKKPRSQHKTRSSKNMTRQSLQASSNFQTNQSYADDKIGCAQEETLYATIDTNVYKDGDSLLMQDSHPHNDVHSAADPPAITTAKPIYKTDDVTLSVDQRLQLYTTNSICGDSNEDQQSASMTLQQQQQQQRMQSIKINTLSMDTSLQVESLKQELRRKKETAGQIKGGITKMGGFRRPTSSSFYQVKKGGINRPTGKQLKKVNEDLPFNASSNPGTHQGSGNAQQPHGQKGGKLRSLYHPQRQQPAPVQGSRVQEYRYDQQQQLQEEQELISRFEEMDDQTTMHNKSVSVQFAENAADDDCDHGDDLSETYL